MSEEKIRFYNDAVHSYMVLPCDQEESKGYRYRMLAANRIEGLLPCTLRYIEDSCFLYYEVTGKQSLAVICENCVISGLQLRQFLESLAAVNKTLSEYLLSAGDLLLGPEYIYLDPQTGKYAFTYCPNPELKKNPDCSMQGLAEFLAAHIEQADREAAGCAYRLCTMAASSQDFVLTDKTLEALSGGTAETFQPEQPEKRPVRAEIPPFHPEDVYRAETYPPPGPLPGEKTQGIPAGFRSTQGKRPAILPAELSPDPEAVSDDENRGDRYPGRSETAPYKDTDAGGAFTLALFMGILAFFLFWISNVMRLRDRELIIGRSVGGVMAAVAVIALVFGIVKMKSAGRADHTEM